MEPEVILKTNHAPEWAKKSVIEFLVFCFFVIFF